MILTKVICTLKNDVTDLSTTLIVEIDDNFQEYQDDMRISAAYNKLKWTGMLSPSFMATENHFKSKFNFTFE
jgi:hypothetical protein